MHKPKKIIIIGGNAAGPSAAAKAKRVNPDADVRLYESSNFISTGTCELPYLLSGEIDNYEHIVFFSPKKFFDEKGVHVFVNHTVMSIDTKFKEIEVINNSDKSVLNVEYDKLILATGSKANEISEIPFFLENVFPYKSVKDYLNVENYINSNNVEKVLVIGSGYIGLEVADALKTFGIETAVFEKEELPMPSADKEVQYLIKDLMKSLNIDFINKNESSRFIIESNKFKQLKHEGRFIDFDMVIVAAGVSPNIDLAESIGLKIGNLGGIRVDARLKTSNSDIYAAGDNIEIKNKINNDYDYFPLATYAHSFGHIAGENAAGGNLISDPVIMNSAFKFAGKYIASVGLSEMKAKEYFVNCRAVSAVANNKVKVMPDSEKVFGKLLFDSSTKMILGASFVGKEEVAGYADLVAGMIYTKSPAHNLAKINYNYTPPLSPFINLMSILGRKISETI